METHARPIRRTRVRTGRRQGVGGSARGGDQEVDLKVWNPVWGFVGSSRLGVLHGGMIGFWALYFREEFPLVTCFLDLHFCYDTFVYYGKRTASWHNIVS